VTGNDLANAVGSAMTALFIGGIVIGGLVGAGIYALVTWLC
jgi:hypothetical protein